MLDNEPTAVTLALFLFIPMIPCVSFLQHLLNTSKKKVHVVILQTIVKYIPHNIRLKATSSSYPGLRLYGFLQ